MNTNKYQYRMPGAHPFDPYRECARKDRELQAAEYHHHHLASRLRRAQGIARAALGYSILTTIALALLLLIP